MIQKNYRFLLMDLDGTLYDFAKAEASAFSDLMSSWGLTCTADSIRAYHNFNDACWKALERGEISKERLKSKRFEDFLAYIHFDYDPVQAGLEYAEYLSHYGFLLPGARQLLEALSGRYELYAVTNGIQKTQEGRMAASGVGIYFNNMFVSEEIGIAKPHIEYFTHVFASIPGFQKDQALLIGDSLSSDMQGGFNAGIDTLWYNPQHLTRPEDLPVTYEMDSLSDICLFLTGKSE